MRFSLRHLLGLGPLLALTCGGVVRAQTPPPESPFLPPNPAVSASHAQSSEPYQLSAIGVVGDKTFVSIYEAAEKRSRWVAVGDRLGDLQVVSCDIEGERAVVTIAGETRTLTLPKPAVTTAAAGAPAAPVAGLPANAPSAAPAEGAPAAAATATSEEDQAREARMLVSDLLEIGMQQRKAYEEAQKQAAAQRNGEKPAETSAN
jgi:hypothetical protein